eukprot:2756544-Amphidinium_carterae.1
MDVDNAVPHPEDVVLQPELPVQGGDTTADVDNHRQAESAYKPTHRLTGKQSPPHPIRAIVAQLDDIENTNEIRLENNEDKEEKRQM